MLGGWDVGDIEQALFRVQDDRAGVRRITHCLAADDDGVRVVKI